MKFSRIAIIAGLLLAGAIAYEESGPTPATAVATPSVLVTELRLAPGTLPQTLTAYGSIQPGPGAERVIAPPAGGILASLAVAPGQRVAAGEPLASLIPDAASVAEDEKAAGAVAAAKFNMAHVSALLAAHLATNADLTAAAQALRDAQAALAALRATGAGTSRRIDAPFGGIVTAVLAAPGTMFAPATPLLRMVSTAGLVAAVGLPPAQAAGIKPGDPARLQMLDTGAAFPAHVTAIQIMLDPQTGLAGLQVTPDGTAPFLLNQPVAARITAQMLAGYVVPRNAVQSDEQGDFVYQIDADNIAHRVTVHVLGRQGGQSVIAETIDAALPIAVTGTAQLTEGMMVRTAP